MSQKTRIFLSYASEDSPIANAIYTALSTLSNHLNGEIETYCDIHSFSQGRSLTEEVLTKLEESDILFIIYTEAPKKSYSWTGVEVGAFRMLMQQEVEKNRKTERRIISLFLNESPPSERDILGIQLDTGALGRDAHDITRHSPLDPQGKLLEFLLDISDSITERLFKATHSRTEITGDLAGDLTRTQAARRKTIENDILPILERDLVKSLSAIVTSQSIEQSLFEIRWKSRDENPLDRLDLLDGAELKGAVEVFGLFGIHYDQPRMAWELFKEELRKAHDAHASFIIDALTDAVRSSVDAGPVDNEQFFVTRDEKLYRIIVTRHYQFFDGSRVLHVYFIPMLLRSNETPPAKVLALLNVTTRYRMTFLSEEAKLSVRKFSAARARLSTFKQLIRDFVRAMMLIEDEAHVYRLDDPRVIQDIISPEVQDDEIVAMFNDWRKRRDSIMELALQVDRMSSESAEYAGAADKWVHELGEFVEFARPINLQNAARATQKLQIWFAGE